MNRTMLETILLILSISVSVMGYPTGPPESECDTMLPGHGAAVQTTPVPYTISFGNDATTYSPNEEIQVTLQGSTNFLGFYIQARSSSSDNTKYGSMTILTNGKAACSNGAVSHEDRNSKSSVTLTWTAPSADVYTGSIVFVYTVVQSANVYWVKQVSSTLSYKAAAVTVPPITQPVITQSTTTQAQSSNRPTSINRDTACKVTKGCFPEECNTNCDYLVTWEDINTEEMQFTVQRKISSNNYYIAVGLSDDAIMRNDSVALCISRDGQVLVQSAYNPGKYNELLDNSVFGVEMVDSYYANGILGCTYKRKKNAEYASAINGRKKRATANAATFFDLESDWYLFVAHGNANLGSVTKHSETPVISVEKIDFQNVQGPAVGTTTTNPNAVNEVTKDSKCGSELGCFHDCEGESNCNFLFTWKIGGGDETECTMTCKQGTNKYCAIGWSKDDKMGDDYVLAFGPNSGQIEVKNFYNVKSSKFCDAFDDPYLGLRLISQSYSNGVMYVKFARSKTFALAQSSSGRKKRAASDASTFFDMNEAFTLFNARGSYIAGSISKHSAPPLVSSRKADFQKAEDLGAEATKVDLVYLHATLMVAAWMFFASFGIFTARYYKLVWQDDAKLCGEKRWFSMHRFCMVMAFLLCAAGFVVIFVHVEGYSEIVGTRFEESHPIIGIVVMSLALLNPTIAIFRPHPGTKYRPVFNFFHYIFGQGAHSLSIVNIFSGTILSAANVPSYIRIILYVFVGWIVVTEVAFIIMTYCFRKKDRSEAYEMRAKGGGNSETNSQSNSRGKTLFLGVHAVILSGFAAAIAVIVWTDRDV